MTQPSLNTTFDTSLVDLQTGNSSFSTTNSDPSMYNVANVLEEPVSSPTVTNQLSQPTPAATSPAPSTSKRIHYLPTVDAYDAWASVYDTDGNMLQALDDVELADMLPSFLQTALSNAPEAGQTIRVTDMGCGTARNTLKLLSYPWPPNATIEITGVDASAGMLDVAQLKMTRAQSKLSQSLQERLKTKFVRSDFLESVPESTGSGIQSSDAVISTLVLEHLPLHVYFSTLQSAIRPGGYVLMTNMHPEMGAMSQAGFVQLDPETGERIKVRPTSYAHGVQETVDAAIAHGFEIIGNVEERGVDEDVVEKLGERGKKWIGVKVWYGMVLRRVVK